MKKLVYMDNAATTRLSKAALDAAMPFLSDGYGNPSSIYSLGCDAKKAVEEARAAVADAIGALPEEVYFTGGGTESDNWAIKSAARLARDKSRRGGGTAGTNGSESSGTDLREKKHIVSSAIEHPAVINTLKSLEKEGFDVTYLGVDELGQVSPDELRDAIREETALVSIMMANNEIGTILPVAELGAIAKESGVLFHTDAVQAVGHIPVNVKEMNIDMMSFSGHKLGGMKGTGVLYLRKGLRLPPLLHGGGQERGGRAGTENVAGIVSLAAALNDLLANNPHERVMKMRDRLIGGLLALPKVRLTGDSKNRLPGIASFVFEGIEGESILLMLDQNGICASSGSACSSGSLDPSHVLLAIGLPHEIAHGSLRLSLSGNNTDEDVDYVLEVLPGIVERLRSMSPVWNG